MTRFDPLFSNPNKQEPFEVSASIAKNFTPPVSPFSKKPMLPSYAVLDGRKVNMYMDMENRIAYPASKDDNF